MIISRKSFKIIQQKIVIKIRYLGTMLHDNIFYNESGNLQ